MTTATITAIAVIVAVFPAFARQAGGPPPSTPEWTQEQGALSNLRGRSGPDDPQYGLLPPIDRVVNVRVIADGEVLRVGPLAVRGHFTGGHTPGGTSWTWRSCEGSECLTIVYADSMTAVSADTFKFSSSTTYPRAVADFEKSIAFLRKAPCDLLLTPHPDASGLWGRVAKRDAGDTNALVERGHCSRYADRAETGLRTRLAREK